MTTFNWNVKNWHECRQALQKIKAWLGDLNDEIFPPAGYGYTNPAVSLTGGGSYERGNSVSNPVVNWTVTYDARHPIEWQNLTTLGDIDPVQLTGSHTYTGETLTTNTTKTMQVRDTVSGAYGGTTKSGSTSWTFYDQRIWGVHAAASISSAQLLTLSLEQSTNYTQTRYFDPTAQYIYFAWPDSWGGDRNIFTVNNLPNTAWEISTISHTNASGGVLDYRVFRSTFLQSGSNIKVEVA